MTDILHAHHYPEADHRYPWQIFLAGDRWALVSGDGPKAVSIDGPYITEPGEPEAAPPAHILAAAARAAA